MDQAERDALLAIVRSTPDRLKAALAGVSKRLLMWRPAPGKWSIHEIVCHMRDAERLGLIRGLIPLALQTSSRQPTWDKAVRLR